MRRDSPDFHDGFCDTKHGEILLSTHMLL